MDETEREVATTVIYCCVNNLQNLATITISHDPVGWNLGNYTSLSWYHSWAAVF